MKHSRREFIVTSCGLGATAAHRLRVGAAIATGSAIGAGGHYAVAATRTQFGEAELVVLSDGRLTLPSGLVLPDTISATEKSAFLSANNINTRQFSPDCNLAMWRSEGRVVLFDVGAGPHFMPSAGKLLEDIEALGVEPTDITDVVFTHAHPDHLWGLIDDFDELAFPEANYYMHAAEWDYWQHKDTLDSLPEARKTFAVGALNRMAYIKERINLFQYGDEIIPGIEAVDTHGHSPGHTSFALHQGSSSVMVIGDALIHSVISFQKANWPSASDQDQQAGIATRMALLDRLAQDNMQILGFHLPYPGLGTVDKIDNTYRYVSA